MDSCRAEIWKYCCQWIHFSPLCTLAEYVVDTEDCSIKKDGELHREGFCVDRKQKKMY